MMELYDCDLWDTCLQDVLYCDCQPRLSVISCAFAFNTNSIQFVVVNVANQNEGFEWKLTPTGLSLIFQDVQIGQRMITISTVGVPNTIKKLASYKLQSTLALRYLTIGSIVNFNYVSCFCESCLVMYVWLTTKKGQTSTLCCCNSISFYFCMPFWAAFFLLEIVKWKAC